jgi:hypothetical protein
LREQSLAEAASHNIFRAAPCRKYREAICHAQIQRTQKAEKNCATTAAASNATPAVIPAAAAATTTSATRSITLSKAIVNAAT